MKGNKSGVILLGVAIISVVIIMYGLGWFYNIPPPVQPAPPGNHPVATYVTHIEISEPYWTLQPHIDSVSVTRTGWTPLSTGGRFEAMIWPWEGVLKMIVAYPGGQIQVYTMNIKIDWGTSKSFDMYWQTRQVGKHIVTVELLNNKGQIIDSKEVVVNRGG